MAQSAQNIEIKKIQVELKSCILACLIKDFPYENACKMCS